MTSNKNKDLPDLETILKEINTLVYQPGYVYALFMIVIHDLFLPIDKYIEVNWWERLTYQEVSFLFGILTKKPLDLLTYPEPKQTELYVSQTNKLLDILHKHYTSIGFKTMMEKAIEEQGKTPSTLPFFSCPESIIEPIFYGDSGAYDFQYWDMSIKRYAMDNDWIKAKFGFSIENAVDFSKKIKDKVEKNKGLKIPKDYKDFCDLIINIFTVDILELGMEEKAVRGLAERFSITPGECNKSFNSPSDFNELIVKPLIKITATKYLIPVSFDLAKAVDENPFYWVKEVDENYFPTFLKNRGDYTEKLNFDLLKKVFGDNVYCGVKIQRKKGEGIKSKGREYTDVDILVLFKNKAIIVQAKSKKMQLLSKQGDLIKVASDFKSAIQDAYDQGVESRKHILSKDAIFVDKNGNELSLEEPINDIYIILTTTDNYPALQPQLHVFLEKEESEPFPIAINLFDLDLLTTYLPDPYDFLYYIHQRTKLSDKIISGTEIACLGFHLDRRLYLDPKEDMTHIMVSSDFGQLIDDDVMRQRYGSKKDKEESKIKQKWKNESFNILVEQIKSSGVSGLTDAVFFLYSLSSDTIDVLLKNIERLKKKSILENKPYSMAIPLTSGVGGITYVVDSDRSVDLFKHIMGYSVMKKHVTKSNEWLGLGSYSNSPRIIDCVVYTKEPWKPNEELLSFSEKTLKHGQIITNKIGRNNPCYCGSGLKYKKCHYLKGE